MSDRGLLIVLSGFSGSGKGTIVKELLKRYPDRYALSISATTRSPRVGEENGKDYFFHTKEEFLQMIENNELLEYACYVENYYGTPKAYVMEQLNKGKNVILEIEIQGALKIKEQFPETLLLFVTPPTAEELRRRLTDRGTETAEVIKNRLARAEVEADGCEVYDYLVINDDLGTAVEEINQIIHSEKSKMCRNFVRIETIKMQLKEFAKGEN